MCVSFFFLRIIGWFEMRQPIFMARDPELVHTLCVKKFEYFVNHKLFFENESDTLFGNSVLLLENEKWRDMRTTLSPAFTGSKMRQMFDLALDCSEEIVVHLKRQINNGKSTEKEMMEMFRRCANDAIASCVFGIKVNSFEDPKNEFYSVGKKIIKFKGLKEAFRIILLQSIPKVMKILGVELILSKYKKFMYTLVQDNMKIREANHIVRPDLINMMMQLKKGQSLNSSEVIDTNLSTNEFATKNSSEVNSNGRIKQSWTDDEIVAQCFIFFAAGIDTTTTLMSFMAYELALSSEIQDQLYEEIRTMNESLNGKRINYESITKLKYLDQVVTETLRKWPSFIDNDRVCSKDFLYEDKKNNRRFTIKKGQSVRFPIYCIQHDPKYYPDPEEFDPSRFSGENKHKIVPGTFLTFGSGPRACIGE